MGFRTNILQFDKNNNVEDFTFVLSTKMKKHLGKLTNIKPDTVRLKRNLNGANELSFDVYKNIDGEVEPLWTKIIDLRLIYVKEIDEYFQIQVSHNDQLDAIKTITGTSLCEAELSQTNLYDTEINTEADIERDAYVITKFYDKDNPEGSLLHRVLKEVPHYSIKYVDDSLKNLQRSFSINGTSIYEFLTGECSEQFNCLFTFNSVDRSISVYDLYTVCKECGYRGEYSDVCPECGSSELKYFGEDTSIFVNNENLTDSVKFETDVDSIKNCFKLTAGDDVMTAAVINLNQNGSPYIYYISPEQKEDMSTDLVEKIESYDVLYDSYTVEYQQLIQDYYDIVDEVLYYTSEMMPESGAEDNEEDDDSTETLAEQEAKNLTEANLSPLGLTSVTKSTSKTTVESAIKNYARVFVNTGYVKLDIHESAFDYVGEDEYGYSYGEWVGVIKVTNYSDKEDVAYSEKLRIRVHDNYTDFIDQKIKKDVLKNSDDEDGSIFNVLEIDDLELFKESLELYCLNRLKSFYDAIQTALDVLVEADQASEGADLYEDFYLNYYNKLQACQAEMDQRQSTVDELEKTKNNITDRIGEIQKILNFEDYLGEDLYIEFCAYRRDGEYSNSNYISDGLDNAEIIQNAKDFLETAKKELIKSATRQHSISTDLYNLLVMEEFRGIIDKFALGNFIRVQVDDNIYRLRLVSYEINFSDIQRIHVEFSDMTQTANGVNDVQSILSAAASMSSSYAYVSKQAEKGNNANNTLIDFVQVGITSADMAIKNNIHEEVTYGKFGIICKAWDDIENDYSPEQFRITHNLLVFTNNNWKSTITAIGKHDYYKYVDGILVKDTAFGISTQFMTAGYVNGSQIIGGEIFSQNYSPTTGTYINLIFGDFSFAGGKLTYDSVKNKLNFTGTITFEGIDYSDAETKQELKDSLGITDVENDISDFNNSSILTPMEKQDMLDDWNVIQEEYKKNIELAKAFGVYDDAVTTAYINAYNTLATQIAKCGLDNLSTTTSIDTRIYNDINNYHLANVDLAVLINEKAKELSEQALVDAKAYTNQEIETLSENVNKEINDLNDELETTEEYIDGVFKDGIVDDIELSKINQLLKQLDLEKADVDKEYTAVYNNSFLSTETKTSLNTVYTTYNNAHTSLVNTINTAITTLNSTATQAEKQNKVAAVDTSFDTYKTAITNVHEKLNSAVDEISTLKVSDLRENVNKDIEEVNSLIDDTQEYVDNAFYDKVISQSESKSIEQHINQLNTEKSDLDARYSSIYNNSSISTASKTSLKTAKDNYDKSHSSLITLISTAVTVMQDTSKTETQKNTVITNMNNGFDDYQSKLSALSSAFESAIDSISTNKLDTFIDGDYKTFVENIQTQVDGKSETYYQSYQPYANHINVTNNADYNKLVGDLWYDSDESVKKTYVYTKTANGSNYNYQWTEMEVPTEIFDLADGKAKIFTSKPSNYNANDLWLVGSDYTPSISGVKEGYVLVSTKNNTGYTESDWVLSVTYTDDSALTTFIDGEYKEALENIDTQIDAKADTYYQSSFPYNDYTNVADNSTYNLRVGDLCYRTDLNKSYMYTKTANGSNYNYQWKEIDGVPDEIYDSIDSKKQVFVTTPTAPYYKGDLWVQGTSGDILYCNITRESGSYTASDWSKASKYTDDTVANSALEVANNAISDNVLTPAEKRDIQMEVNNITASYNKIIGIVSVSNSSYYNLNYNTIYNYYKKVYSDLISGLNSTYGFSDTNISAITTLTSNGVTAFKTLFNNYYNYEEQVLKLIQDISDGDIANAQDSADAAQESANEALDLLSAIAADDKVTPVEKLQLQEKQNEITASYNKVIEKYGASSKYESCTSYNSFKTAYNTINTILSDILSNMSETYDFTIATYTRDAYISAIEGYYSAYQDFTNYITTELETSIENVQTLATEAKAYGAELAKCLGFTTEISSDYIISPYIGGGYLKITSATRGSVIIDPLGITNGSYIFGVYNKSNQLVMGVKASGDGVFYGSVKTVLDANVKDYVLMDGNGISIYGVTGRQIYLSEINLETDDSGVPTIEGGLIQGCWDTGALYFGFQESSSSNVAVKSLIIKNHCNTDIGYTINSYDPNIWMRGLVYISGGLKIGSGTIDCYTVNCSGINCSGIIKASSAFYLENDTISITCGRVSAWDGTSFGINASQTGTGLYVFGNIGCSGTKERIIQTRHYGAVELNAYETATPYFGDIGSGQCDENGLCYIYLDEIFKEVILTNCEYYVFLQQYGDTSVYPIEKNQDYFIVKGEPYQKFDFEIKARQYGTENMRLNRAADIIESEEDINE